MARTWVLLPLLLLQLTVWTSVEGQCVPRTFDYDSFVCVCNATFCDEPGVVDPPLPGTYALFTSTRNSERFSSSSGDVETEPASTTATIAVDTTAHFQKILGFGGSFTDSAGHTINSLSSGARENALRAYFAPEGIKYSVCRVPIGGSDFSSRPYSLDDVEGDVDLKFWSLQPEDLHDKIPNIIRAMEISDEEVLIFGSPWSPPAWMKTNGMFTGSGALLPEMWQPYANYLVKWAEAYEAAGVPLWGLTPQNEPMSEERDWPINVCRWPREDMRDWLRDHLGPSLEEAGLRRLKLMVHDFNRDTLPWYIQPLYEDPECMKYIDGVAVHWYEDDVVGPEVLLETHDLDPSKFILYTEACQGADLPDAVSVRLGDWQQAQVYLYDILENLNHWSSGWVDWNMALNTTGGPHWPGWSMDSTIIVNTENNEFYKQPKFYAIGHVSKFMKRGSTVVTTTVRGDGLHAASVLSQDGSVVLVVMNTNVDTVDVSLSIDGSRFINTALPPKSFQTFWVPAE